MGVLWGAVEAEGGRESYVKHEPRVVDGANTPPAARLRVPERLRRYQGMAVKVAAPPMSEAIRLVIASTTILGDAGWGQESSGVRGSAIWN